MFTWHVKPVVRECCLPTRVLIFAGSVGPTTAPVPRTTRPASRRPFTQLHDAKTSRHARIFPSASPPQTAAITLQYQADCQALHVGTSQPPRNHSRDVPGHRPQPSRESVTPRAHANGARSRLSSRRSLPEQERRQQPAGSRPRPYHFDAAASILSTYEIYPPSPNAPRPGPGAEAFHVCRETRPVHAR